MSTTTSDNTLNNDELMDKMALQAIDFLMELYPDIDIDEPMPGTTP
jgi:hypothetical protein